MVLVFHNEFGLQKTTWLPVWLLIIYNCPHSTDDCCLMWFMLEADASSKWCIIDEESKSDGENNTSCFSLFAHFCPNLVHFVGWKLQEIFTLAGVWQKLKMICFKELQNCHFARSWIMIVFVSAFTPLVLIFQDWLINLRIWLMIQQLLESPTHMSVAPWCYTIAWLNNTSKMDLVL